MKSDLVVTFNRGPNDLPEYSIFVRFRLLETVQIPSEVMVIPISQSLKHPLQIKNSSEISEPKSITWNDAKDHMSSLLADPPSSTSCDDVIYEQPLAQLKRLIC